MRKYVTIAAAILACATAASAQSPSLDNFDLANGVNVYTPPVPISVTPAKKKGRGLQQIAYTAPPNLVMAASSSLDGFTTGNSKVDGFILDSCQRHRMDPVLIYATMHQESTFHPRALSPKGASGLMQLMPGTAARMGVTKIWDPQQNIEGGVKYMRYLMDLFNGDVRLALAGYNAGEGAVMRFGYQIPPFNETREYVRRITGRYALMRDPVALEHARRAQSATVASNQAASAPLNLYERSIGAVRLPDGKFILISQ